MHRTTCTRLFLGGVVLAALLLAGLPGLGWSQAAPGKALIVPINGTVRLQMTTKKPIKTVTNPKDTAVSIRTVVGDPTTVLITGQQPDVTRIELTDEDGKKEAYEVIVQLDVEYLRTQLRRTVPTAWIDPIPTSNNSVILSGTVTRAEDVDIILRVAQSIGGVQVINAMRVGGVQQVQLDVGVYQVSRTEFRRMAFNFLGNSRNTFFGSTVGQAVGNPQLLGVGSPQLTVAPTLAGIPGAPNGAPTNILGGVLHNGWGFLFFLQALRDENLAKLMAEPRLVTLSGRPASFLVGGEQAIPVPAGLGQVGVQFEEFGTRLNFLPIVLGNGKIHLEVEPEVSNLDAAAGTTIQGTIVPGRVTNRINTTVEVEVGQTVVLGGLIQRQIIGSTSKVPVLGDIPFINTAFSSKSYQEIEQEVVVLVTPHLVDPQSCDQLSKFFPGQETRSPDDFELFLEGILEAPRGPRQICQNHVYVPAYKNGPTADVFPCAGRNGDCGNGSCGNGACGSGNCANGACGHGKTVQAKVVPSSPVAGKPKSKQPAAAPASAETVTPAAATVPPAPLTAPPASEVPAAAVPAVPASVPEAVEPAVPAEPAETLPAPPTAPLAPLQDPLSEGDK